jgi:hypothetical protein
VASARICQRILRLYQTGRTAIRTLRVNSTIANRAAARPVLALFERDYISIDVNQGRNEITCYETLATHFHPFLLATENFG